MLRFVFDKFFLIAAILFTLFTPFLIRADWTPPPTLPYFCPGDNPACHPPLNVSANPQIKVGPLGISSGELSALNNFFGLRVGLGPGFFGPPNYTANDFSGAVLFVAGKIKMVCPVGGCADGQVLKSDSSGVGDWGDDLWKKPSAGSPDIVNSNSNQKVFIEGALGRLGNTFTGTPSTQSTQINLGLTSTTGGTGSTVGGGNANTASANYSTVVGGQNNIVNKEYGFVGGGGSSVATESNRILFGTHSVIMGGWRHLISTTGGNESNFSTILGGRYNEIGNSSNIGPYQSIGGGWTSRINTTGNGATIGGSENNTIAASYGTALGGQQNSITSSGVSGSIGGGRYNSVTGQYATILGGGRAPSADTNKVLASGNYSTIFGGGTNGNGVSSYSVASGFSSTVIGGQVNRAAGSYSLAAGRNMNLTRQNSFVWGNAASLTTISPTADSFLIFPTAGANQRVGVGTANPSTSVRLDVNGPIRIAGDSLAGLAGDRKLLTWDSSVGYAGWKDPPPPPPLEVGNSVMYLRRAAGGECGASALPACSSFPSWGQATSDTYEAASGSFSNQVRTCVRTDKRCQVIYLTKDIDESACIPTALSLPPVCPSGWTQADLNSVVLDELTASKPPMAFGDPIANRVRTCYRCAP